MFDESACLEVDPFGDEDANITRLKDRFLVTRKGHECTTCLEHIPPKSRVRAKTERDDDDNVLKTFYFCHACCAAMADDFNGDWEPFEARVQMGIDKGAARAESRKAIIAAGADFLL